MINAYATSDVGKARELNEDYFSVSYPEDKIQVFILADGMGGYNGGEVASKLAVQAARAYIEDNYDEVDKENRDLVLRLLKDACQYANMIVYDKATHQPELSQMGTTLDICLVYENKVFIAHIGDSRVYRIRREFIRKLTKDHSYVQTLVDEGKITREEGETHPRKNMLMKALGIQSFIEPDTCVRAFLKDDVILMCSDGLTNMVPESEIYKIIRENPADSTKLLVQKANDEGGKDNITAIVIR